MFSTALVRLFVSRIVQKIHNPISQNTFYHAYIHHHTPNAHNMTE